MVIEGANIYCEGVTADRNSEEKIRQIVSAIKTVSHDSEVSVRFLKVGRVYEGLLWGKAAGTPLGVYRRGASLHQVAESLLLQVRKECLKLWRSNRSSAARDFALAG